MSFHRQQAAKEWLGYLNGVHDLFYDCQNRCESLPEVTRKAARVKIAVLDTGTQLSGALQENYEQEGRINILQSETFVSPTNGEDTHDWRVDLDGHGSRVSQIILEFAPAADLHIAKVFKTRSDLTGPDMAREVHNRIAKVNAL